MLYKEIIAGFSQIHTKHINTLCGQNVELLNVTLVVHTITTGLKRVKFVRRFFLLRQVYSLQKLLPTSHIPTVVVT